MKKIKTILILCFFSLSLFGQTKIVIIEKGTVFWERTISKKDYKKYLKNGEIDNIKTRIYNIAYQNAVMQESSVVSIINSISAYDETNPESAIDAVYSAFQSYSSVEWIEGPYKIYQEKENSKFGTNAITITCIVYGKFKRTLTTGNLPDNEYFITLINKNKHIQKKNQNLPIITINFKKFMIMPKDFDGTYTFEQAKKICESSTAYGYNDWYLPSDIDLLVICEHRKEIGNFKNNYYWSSTEYGNSSQWGTFGTGCDECVMIYRFPKRKRKKGNFTINVKHKAHFVRAIRAL